MPFTPDHGVGFPSACRALVPLPPNQNDANGYYEFIGLPPSANQKTIRRRCRRLLAMYHPDGSDPDEYMFARVKRVYEVLCNDSQKALYDSLDNGRFMVDEFSKESMEKGELKAVPDEPRPIFFTYFSDSPDPGDRAAAEVWYELLLEAAHEAGHDSSFQLYLTNKRVNGVVRREVYVYKFGPTIERARAMMQQMTNV